jgi:hypothetical protein
VWLEQKNGRENGCALGRRCKEDISHPTSSGPIARLHASVGSSQRAATADLQQARNFTRHRYFPSTGEVIRRTQDLLDWVIHYYAWSRAVHPSLASRIPAHAIKRVGDHQQAAPQTRFRPGQLARHNRGEVPAYRIAPSSCPPRQKAITNRTPWEWHSGDTCRAFQSLVLQYIRKWPRSPSSTPDNCSAGIAPRQPTQN